MTSWRLIRVVCVNDNRIRLPSSINIVNSRNEGFMHVIWSPRHASEIRTKLLDVPYALEKTRTSHRRTAIETKRTQISTSCEERAGQSIPGEPETCQECKVTVGVGTWASVSCVSSVELVDDVPFEHCGLGWMKELIHDGFRVCWLETLFEEKGSICSRMPHVANALNTDILVVASNAIDQDRRKYLTIVPVTEKEERKIEDVSVVWHLLY